MIPMRMKPVVKAVHSKYQKHLIPSFYPITEPHICTTPEGESQAEESENNAHQQQPKIPSWFQHHDRGKLPMLFMAA